MQSESRNMLGDGPAIELVRRQIRLVAPLSTPVLIEGETGTGKTLAAQLIHTLSDRRSAPIVAINCAAIPDSLLVAELFGHTRGAFTGAVQARIGRIAAADGGTLILDQVDQLSSDIQRVLLPFLEKGEIIPIGTSEARKVDVRVIAIAQDLQSSLASGAIRADFYYRLAAFQIRIPPLRERPEDIPILAEEFLRQFSQGGAGNEGHSIGAKGISVLKSYRLPGNVRELISMIQRATILSQTRNIDAALSEMVSSESGIYLSHEATSERELESARSKIEGLNAELEALRATHIRAQPIWQGKSFSTWHDYCFVLMPFGIEFQVQSVYKDHVKAVVERSGLRCQRADDFYDVSGVMQSVWEGINRARLIIADVTGRNPNVFYELGIAHTLGKQVVIITQSIDYVPFDLRHLRCCVYEYTPPGAMKLEERLGRTIQNLLSNSADLKP